MSDWRRAEAERKLRAGVHEAWMALRGQSEVLDDLVATLDDLEEVARLLSPVVARVQAAADALADAADAGETLDWLDLRDLCRRPA